MHDKIIPHQWLNGYKDIADDDVAFVNMSIRESKWRQITKITITTSKNINASILRTILKKKK
jgi:hypothetical protein